jgi:hypothetical protein
MNMQETLAATPRRASRGQLVANPDSTGSEASPISCASFFGCLQSRWTSKY